MCLLDLVVYGGIADVEVLRIAQFVWNVTKLCWVVVFSDVRVLNESTNMKS